MTETANIQTGSPPIDQISPGTHAALDRFFAEQGQGFNAYLATRQHLRQIERLSALTDAELAERGLDRGDIPAYVFRDLF